MKSEADDEELDDILEPPVENRRSESPPQNFDDFMRNIPNRKSMGHVPLIDGTLMQPGFGISAPKKAGVWTVIYRYFFFLLNLIFVIAGIASIGFGIYGVIRVKVDGVNDPILICSDPAFLALIIGTKFSFQIIFLNKILRHFDRTDISKRCAGFSSIPYNYAQLLRMDFNSAFLCIFYWFNCNLVNGQVVTKILQLHY